MRLNVLYEDHKQFHHLYKIDKNPLLDQQNYHKNQGFFAHVKVKMTDFGNSSYLKREFEEIFMNDPSMPKIRTTLPFCMPTNTMLDKIK